MALIHAHIRIPILLLKSSEAARLYVYLKFVYNGYAIVNYAKWGEDLGMAPRVVKQTLERLISLGWVERDKKRTKGLYVRGYKTVTGKKRYKRTEVDIEHVLCKEKWEAFATSVAMQYLKEAQDPRKARFNSGPDEICNENRPEWEYQLGGVSCSLIAAFFDISLMTAWRRRKKAAMLGYVKIWPRSVKWDMTTKAFLSQKSRNPDFDPSVFIGADGVIKKRLAHGCKTDILITR